ncbi:hypothetical protein AB0H58_24460 [Nocardia neocaledoniensis]|uniref:hypothetical protein n=1 Tax=Nocardia neocaledoniensis TaxID=236511 RepID=UPI0034096311
MGAKGYAFDDLLGRLVGCRLYSVQFVMDYLQIHFYSESSDDLPRLNCDVWPVVVGAGVSLREGMAGYSDALRQLICQKVVGTTEGEGAGFSIEFESVALVFRPGADEIQTPEIAYLSGFSDRRWMVWRPGEEAFEYLD